MVYAIALVSAVLYGAADFIGGLASRRAATIAVVVLSQASGLVLLGLVIPFTGGTASRADLGWGAAAGLAGGVGVALLYRALAVGVMAIVAPVTAVCAVTIPVAAGLLSGERPGTVVLFGIALALVAIVLVSQSAAASSDSGDRGRVAPVHTSGVTLALMSGVAIGFFFLALARTAPAAGLWPLVAARAASVALFALMGLASGTSWRMPHRVLGWALAGGALDMLANALYLVATHRGTLSVVVTLASLYPASTVMLAWLFLGERLSRVQAAGIACALAAVILIVGGE